MICSIIIEIIYYYVKMNDKGGCQMELKQLEYFMTLCQELHFTRAAEKLGIAQPSLSQQIRLLEHEIGTPLFDRVGKKL